MSKRNPLSFNNEELAKNLKDSTGKGMDAFFSLTPQPQILKQIKKVKLHTEQESKEAKINKTKQKSSNKNNIVSNITSNITILQFTDDEIEELREPAYKNQTFRLTEKEIDWIKDTSYLLSKEIKHKKISQADILRVSFKLFQKLLKNNKAELIKILQEIL